MTTKSTKSLKALTVRQPWCGAIVAGFKDTENRSRPTSYTGLLIVHAGSTYSTRGELDERIQRIHEAVDPRLFQLGAIVGTVDLIDCHRDVGCCRPWGESSYTHADGHIVEEVYHFVLVDPKPILPPIEYSGRLGLWTVDPDTAEAITVATA